MAKLKTQRAWGIYEDDGSFSDAVSDVVLRAVCQPGAHGEVPVLVVPEEALKGCRHEKAILGEAGTERWCCVCGSYKDERYAPSRWQRPRVLRVAR